MKPTLVILAAGMGSRYGGLKQLEQVGPCGATLMDYTVFDAVRYGFGKIVFVIRPEMETAFRASVAARFEDRVAVAYAFQRADALPSAFASRSSRTKPWGTGHALLCAEDVVDGPFAAVNADDYYGAVAMQRVGEFLAAPQAGAMATHALAGYALRDTLSEAGGVNRAVCTITPDGFLEEVVETVNIETDGDGGRFLDGDGAARPIAGGAIVSMNLWAFMPSIFDELRGGFETFLRATGADDESEFYISVAVREALHAGRARMKVLLGNTVWCGVTHKEDQPRVVEIIGRLIANGTYPSELWA